MGMSTLKIDMDIGVDERRAGRSQEKVHRLAHQPRHQRHRNFGRKVERHPHSRHLEQLCHKALRHRLRLHQWALRHSPRLHRQA